MQENDYYRRPGWTVDRTLRRGQVVRRGTEGNYRRIELGPGEPHVVRGDLIERPCSTRIAVRLLSLVHLTDLQLADVSSPGRLEFLQRLMGRPGMASMLPSYRAHELVAAHAFETMLATINRLMLQGERNIRPDVALTTGDIIDNQQWNELQWFFALMNGAKNFRAHSGRIGTENVHSPDWGDGSYWRPDSGDDDYKIRWGFPDRPGLTNAATAPFDATGLSLPWLACFGNHDGLVQGRAPASPEYSEIVTGALKSAGVSPHLLSGGDDGPPDFLSNTCEYFSGPTRLVTADKERRLMTRAEFVAAHFADGGAPSGHGFTETNLEQGTAYYVADEHQSVRLIMLDTTNPGGAVDGSVGLQQFRWLEKRLREVHARYLDEDGLWVTTDNPDKLVVIASHHGLSTLTNPVTGADPYQPESVSDLPRILAPDLRRLMHRFPNVVLWVSGHTHRNSVRPCPGPQGGFWELTTSAITDWPCQARHLEIGLTESGAVAITTTMIDHQAPPLPDDAREVELLAALHRELAANQPESVGGHTARGGRGDRNAVLLLPTPFTFPVSG
ncbi:TIGR03767 family metallophosphoesterase [Streptomyces sp. NPDC019396]|uniref:TIGR03767 family metallophosphoesterase n=1 Tax=Streptomyces sp. NPDC019396 TaxID=3154687 RepID=UPI0033E0D452